MFRKLYNGFQGLNLTADASQVVKSIRNTINARLFFLRSRSSIMFVGSDLSLYGFSYALPPTACRVRSNGRVDPIKAFIGVKGFFHSTLDSMGKSVHSDRTSRETGSDGHRRGF